MPHCAVFICHWLPLCTTLYRGVRKMGRQKKTIKELMCTWYFRARIKENKNTRGRALGNIERCVCVCVSFNILGICEFLISVDLWSCRFVSSHTRASPNTQQRIERIQNTRWKTTSKELVFFHDFTFYGIAYYNSSLLFLYFIFIREKKQFILCVAHGVCVCTYVLWMCLCVIPRAIQKLQKITCSCGTLHQKFVWYFVVAAAVVSLSYWWICKNSFHFFCSFFVVVVVIVITVSEAF